VSWLCEKAHNMADKRCSHGRVRTQCMECDTCPHGRRRNMCALCNPCPHGKLRNKCGDCNPKTLPSRGDERKREPGGAAKKTMRKQQQQQQQQQSDPTDATRRDSFKQDLTEFYESPWLQKELEKLASQKKKGPRPYRARPRRRLPRRKAPIRKTTNPPTRVRSPR
jgi:hypothetical protein